MIKGIILFGIASVLLTSCYYDNAEEIYGQEPCDVSAVTYSQDVNIIINNNCLVCHSGTAPIGIVDLSTYGGVSASAAEIKRRINLPASSPGAMPPGGAMSACNIEKVTMWIDQGAMNN